MYCHVFQIVCFQHVRACTDFLGELRLWNPSPCTACSCAVHLPECVMVVHISCLFLRKIVHEFPTLPLKFQPAELPTFQKIRVSTPEVQGRESLGKSFSRSWSLTSMFPYCDFRVMINTSFLAAQTCSYCSLIQNSYRRKHPLPPSANSCLRKARCIPAAGMWQTTSQAVLQTFLKLSLGEALESTGGSAVQCSETSWQRETCFSTYKMRTFARYCLYTFFFLFIFIQSEFP